MNDKFKKIIASIRDAEDEAGGELETCKAFDQQAILAYIEAELNGQEAETMYPELTTHLKECADCYEIYSDLRTILVMEQQGQLLNPPRQGKFDLSFLDQSSPGLWQVTQGNIRRLAQEITAQLGSQFMTLINLPELLQSYHRPMLQGGLFRSSPAQGAGPEEKPETLELPDPEVNMCFRVTTGPVEARQGAVTVKAEQLEPRQALRQVWVTLFDQDNHLLESGLTTTAGEIRFDELRAGKYVIQMEHEQHQWQFDLNLREQ